MLKRKRISLENLNSGVPMLPPTYDTLTYSLMNPIEKELNGIIDHSNSSSSSCFF